MSENQLMNQKNVADKEQQQALYESILGVYEANQVNQIQREEKLRQFYASLEFPCCGDYLEPKLDTISKIKHEKGKVFILNEKEQQIAKNIPYDGLFEHRDIETQVSSNELIRQKTRFIRDGREEYFQENGDFVAESQFFHSHLSRLANISFEENLAIRTFQKNAILSERNNQKKNLPFELQINIGCLWLTRHALQNQQQRRFQELRPIMKDYAMMSSYPALPELARQIQFLHKIKQRMIQMDASQQEKQQIESKIQIAKTMYNKEVDKVKLVMLSVLAKWKQVKEARRASGLETVPWKLNVKQYEIEGQKSYDLGLTPMELNPLGENSSAQHIRRQDIRKQRYFVKIYINGYEVAKSEKVHLNWPSFKVLINQKFNVTVYSAPSSIQIEVIKVGIINQTIDIISLALPGVNSKTITSSEQRYAGALFSLNGPKFRKGQQEVSPPSGMIVYRIEWKGEGSRMPPVSFKAQEEQTAATEETEEEVDYQELYDIKDPRIPHKARKEEMDGDFPKGYGALLPFADIQSARHLLLKMKATHPQFQKVQVPLLEEQIRKRQDLLSIIETEKIRSLDQAAVDPEETYNPSEGFFKTQDEQILQEIREILFKIQGVKMNALKGASKVRYKITEQVINQFIFEQMQSPIAIFCKNLFTQKRKLGPKVTYYQQARAVFDDMEVNFHLRSARNMPIRQSAFSQIRNFQEEEARMNPMARLQQMGGHPGNANMNMYGNYANGLFQRPVNMNIQGQNFFVPGMNMGNEGRQPLEAMYKKNSLERNNTYLELRFKKMLKRTQCFEGPFPEWNQTLDFAYNFKNEGMSLQKLFTNNQKMLKLLVFDLTEESKPTTAIAEARIKKTKYFLGRIDIPMSLLVALPSLTGIFRVERPLLLFGYGIKRAGLFDFQPDLEEANKTEFPDHHTFLNLDLFTDPLIDSMTAYNIDRKYVSGEDESTLLLQRASDWLSELNTKRYIRMWLNNIEGKSVFICRWLSSDITPPPQLGNENLIERCARFVAMIPKKFSCKLLENTEDFHFTCDQFMNVKMGEDHGILLCNFFNFIDRKSGRDYIHSYLALGKAFPYGKSIYVLRRNTRTNDSELWDPYDGQCFFLPAKEYENFCCFFRFAKKKGSEQQKDMCSMLELGCIVSPDNIYVNIQEFLKPGELDFELENEKLWKPFLSQRMRGEYFDRGMIRTIQHEITEEYYPKTKGIQSKLENQLYDYIRANLESERRKHFKPYTFKINTNISNVIRNKILYSCETFRMDHRISGGDSRLYSEHFPEQKGRFYKAVEELEQQKNRIKGEIDADKLLYGFTVNMPYTSDKDLWERIQEAHLHLDETENMEFVLSIRCFELACHVISVWVFVGSIA